MLSRMLHATTMNRDGDPTRLSADIDFDAFDDGVDDPGASDPSTATDGGAPWR
jgi:hypothetical protein